jgi:hypothetical protein
MLSASGRGAANHLCATGIPTARGSGAWSAVQVATILAQLPPTSPASGASPNEPGWQVG